MKKLAIGCGLALLLVGIVGSIGFYYFVYTPARSFVASMSQIGEMADLDAKVTNTQPFAAPADDALGEAQVTRFVAVQESLHTRMGTRAAELQARYKAIADGKETAVGIADVVGAYRDLFGIIAEAKRAQVDALNAQAFSVDEYAWVKSRVYEAAGVTATGVDFRELAEKMKNGDLDALQTIVRNAGAAATGAVDTRAAPSAPREPADPPANPPATTTGRIDTDTPGVGIPDRNKALVAPHKDKVATWLIYGAFGL